MVNGTGILLFDRLHALEKGTLPASLRVDHHRAAILGPVTGRPVALAHADAAWIRLRGRERPWIDSTVLFLKSTLLAATLASFGLLAGYRFTAYGRIALVGQLLITLGMIVLLYLHQLHFTLFMLFTAVIQIGFIRLYRTIPDNIPAIG
ncbi:hypothetical protein [Paenibacillus popilliae]|uniref:ATP-dependent Lon protease n=1 Tax=Paenibacillus popilliae ATCC 14706 TaxID=1212764 RepID=M9M4W0_PAEPP|nr:hypothetical protein [Paenibacillus popilliae]GAC42363.1 ATP-dependent Lon protease [Paenibacillus popilliae ATCC 14706]